MKRRVIFAVLCVLALAALVVLGRTGGSGRQDAKTIEGISFTGSSGVTRSVAYLQSHHVRVEPQPAAEEPSAEQGEGGGEVTAAGAQRVGGVDIREKPEPQEEGFPPRRPHGGAPLQRVGQAAVTPESSFSSGTSFLGADSSLSGFVPPDSMGAVGPTQALVSVNGRIRVYSKQGVLGGLNLTDSDFWSTLLPASAEPTDPGVEYDRLAQRWIVSAVDIESKDNLVMLAVSSSPTITDKTSFTFFSFHESLGGTQRFADYPQLGVDNNAIYVGVNLFTSSSGSFAGTEAYVIQKSSVLGAGPINVTGFPLVATSSGSGPDSPQPATDMDPNVGAGYIVGPDNATANQLDVRRVSNPGSLTPTISSDLTVTIPATAQPLAVPAQGTSGGLDALDDRLFEAMIARGPGGTDTLWTAHNIRVNSSGVGTTSGDRDGSRWYQLGTLDTTPSLVQSGTLFDTAVSSPQYFWIPSIAMNGQGHASLNASVAGTGRFAQIAASGRLASDPAGTTESPDIVQTSSSTYNLGSGTPKRWGDYSQTVVDPTDNMTFWTFQEYANSTNSWGLRVIKLQPPPPAIPGSVSPDTILPGQPSVTVNVTGTSSNGSGFFDPGPDAGGPGFPNHISAAVSGGMVVNSVTFVDPTHLTLNLNTTGASNGAKSVTITNPDGQTASCTAPLVVGTGTASPCLGGSGGGGSGGGGSGGGGSNTTTSPKNPPDTSFTKAPKKTHKRRPKFKFTASEAGVSFRCKLDVGSFVPCTSPFKPPKLSLGKHKLQVQAVDSAGVVDPSPAVRKFRVLPPA